MVPLEKRDQLLPNLAAQVPGERGVSGARQCADLQRVLPRLGDLEHVHPSDTAIFELRSLTCSLARMEG